MRIVIDLQGAQNNSRDRGIGRYSLSMAKAMVRNGGTHELIIALNGMFPETIEPIRAAFDELLPQKNIRIWHAVGPVDSMNSANDWRRHAAELVRETFLASLKPDILVILSLFEGFHDNSVLSIGLTPAKFLTAVTSHDLIPLIHSDTYLTPYPSFETRYKEKLSYLKKADLLLAVSESSRRELMDNIGALPCQIINTSEGADPLFARVVSPSAELSDILARYGIKRKFLMHSSAFDERKNFEGLVEAFGALPKSVRKGYQLVLVCKIDDSGRKSLRNIASAVGLEHDELVLTGYVPDDDLVKLYSESYLFVFPSFYEGFGLPVLEAMSCGAAVIGSNTSSIPEVIGREDALFNPKSTASMAVVIERALTDSDFWQSLKEHAISQSKKFSWDNSAKIAIEAFEKHHNEKRAKQVENISADRPKLAYVSPVPPGRSGIADYSSELLPELSRYYDMDVILAQEEVSDKWIIENCITRTVDWFIRHSNDYNRILYQFGNSDYHQHMFGLLEKIPGTVVLHDFFLSGIVDYMDTHGYTHNGWDRELYYSHGYQAIQEESRHGRIYAMRKYPCSKTVLDRAQGVIVHSEYSQRLADHWYGDGFAKDWHVIPHLRVSAITQTRLTARKRLGISEDAFVVSSFGFLAENKQNRRLMDAWIASDLSRDERCLLVFVGETDGLTYCDELAKAIGASGFSERIIITGWTEMEQFRQYLAAADVAVQLRKFSRGETSGTVLDCMNYGLPTIVNAHGSMADLPRDAVCMLPEEFEDSELIYALEKLWKEGNKRNVLSQRAREVIITQHAPRLCAEQYQYAIEKYHQQAQNDSHRLTKAIASLENGPTDEKPWMMLAQAVANNQHLTGLKQLFVDVSGLIQCDLKTGIERVVRSILAELLGNPPPGYRVEPVYATNDKSGYHYARRFTLQFMNCPTQVLEDDPVEVFNGDIFIGLEVQHCIVIAQETFYRHLRNIGVQVFYMVHDLLPILLPHAFPEGTDGNHIKWLEILAQNDGVVCVSRTVADELTDWLKGINQKRFRPFKIGWSHHGADVDGSVPSLGLPLDAAQTLNTLAQRPTFLMVGTIEPRKGHLQTIDAFSSLWQKEMDVNLAIVGYEGWKPLPGNMRRTIPEIVAKIKTHPELSKRLFWLEGISDEYLEKVYATSSCLIAASEGEGFGLPLIEAAQHKLPIIARDIPVFREVAGEHAFYFSGLNPDVLAECVLMWMELDKKRQAPRSDNIPWLTWKQSTRQLLDVILGGQWYRSWMPDDVYRFWGSDRRLSTKVGKRIGREIVSTGLAGHLIYGPYIPLAAGRYRVLMRGTWGIAGAIGAHMDVAVDKGNVILGESALHMADSEGYLVSLPISLLAPCTDLEVRVEVSKETELRVAMIEIAPWKDDRKVS